MRMKETANHKVVYTSEDHESTKGMTIGVHERTHRRKESRVCISVMKRMLDF